MEHRLKKRVDGRHIEVGEIDQHVAQRQPGAVTDLTHAADIVVAVGLPQLRGRGLGGLFVAAINPYEIMDMVVPWSFGAIPRRRAVGRLGDVAQLFQLGHNALGHFVGGLVGESDGQNVAVSLGEAAVDIFVAVTQKHRRPPLRRIGPQRLMRPAGIDIRGVAVGAFLEQQQLEIFSGQRECLA